MQTVQLKVPTLRRNIPENTEHINNTTRTIITYILSEHSQRGIDSIGILLAFKTDNHNLEFILISLQFSYLRLTVPVNSRPTHVKTIIVYDPTPST